MIHLSKNIGLTIVLFLMIVRCTFSYQYYDKSNCTSESEVLGSNYLCTSDKLSCQTFVIYRVQMANKTLSSISALFNFKNVSEIMFYNNISESIQTSLPLGYEIIIPITCDCPDRFSRAIFVYNASVSDSLSSIACGVFEGLVKEQSLKEENPYYGRSDGPDNSLVRVPVRCACPDSFDVSNGIKYLVTYPIVGSDYTDLIARKFGVTQQIIWDANRLSTYTTIFPRTVLIIPTESVPRLNYVVASPAENPTPPQDSSPLGDIIPGKERKQKVEFAVYVAVAVTGAIALVAVSFCMVYLSIKKKNHLRFKNLSPIVPRSSNFSPDFLDGMSKLNDSLICFNLDELRTATEDFSEASLIGSSVYRGNIGDTCLAIEEMRSMKEANHVVYILTKTNHLNVVKLVGFCYGTRPFLLYEYAENCSLRYCLSNPKLAKQLTWAKRMQIAFDLAVGIHYIHYCTKPTYVHRNINSKNVLITADWRAKISDFKLAKPLLFSYQTGETDWNESVIVGKREYLSPEYINEGHASTKVDVYAFGVVLLQLLSAKEAISEEKFLKDSIEFLIQETGDTTVCLEKLKEFMDPVLNGDYNTGDAMTLALLAKGCVEKDTLHRPNMNDVLKAISRML
ncbi:lysM domain receptor-like kinase 4 [Apium graveolens]|uniref:lysM domain receptor-like kinase 4 n=1 Tax=Apium graveolens TaxID=4045 RepID=UPI003D7A508D